MNTVTASPCHTFSLLVVAAYFVGFLLRKWNEMLRGRRSWYITLIELRCMNGLGPVELL